MITLATALCMTTASGQPNWVPAALKITYNNPNSLGNKVGIGTLNPQANLHVYDTLYPSLRFTSWATGTTLQDGTLMGYDANRNFFLYNNEAGNSFFGQSYAFQTGTLPFQDTSFYISSAGKVGVGTTSPSEKFQVNRGNVLIKGANNFSSSGDEAILYLGDNNHYIKSIFGGGLRIGTFGAADAIAVFQSNGSVGIGTSNTGSFKLAVEGKIGAREVEITLQGAWPDYVFEKDYQLLPLPELKKHLEAHHNLPGIPPAGELKENRLPVGEMQARQMAKIEELTLYTIQLYEMIEHTAGENVALRKQIEALKERLAQVETQK